MSDLQWQKLDERVEQVGYKEATIKTFRQPDGNVTEYTTWNAVGSAAAAVVALTKDGRVVIARQYRPGPELILEDIPGGAVDFGEEPIDAAMRELLEETGYTTDEPLVPIGKACSDAYSNCYVYFFLARNCYLTTEQSLDETEFVEVDTIEISQLIENATHGKMSDPAAAFMAYKFLQ